MVHEQTDRILLGLLGAPIKHSASPAMHEAAGAALGLHTFYQLIEMAGADRDGLRRVLDAVRLLGFAGINVTFPYKEAVLPLLDDLSDAVRVVGAVNTIAIRDGRLIGYNTDASGFARALTRLFATSLQGPFALVGAGGVGKAIAFALSDVAAYAGPPEIRIFDTDPAKTASIADALQGRATVLACSSPAQAVEGAQGLINGTPIGMLPDRGTPVPVPLLRPDMWVADAVYMPLWTPLLSAARDVGAPIMTGRELAIDQALDAFAHFTGREASADIMAAAFDRVIAARTPAPGGSTA